MGTRRGRLLGILAIFSIAASVEPTLAVVENGCAAAIQVQGGPPHVQDVPGLRVLDYDEQKRFVPLDADNGTVVSLACRRSSIVPQPADYQVVQAGYPFFIINDERGGILKFQDGKYTFELAPSTTLTPDEDKAVQARLEAYPVAALPPMLARCTQQVVEVVASEDHSYEWRGNKFSIAELQAALETEERNCDITELRLRPGTQKLSIQHSIEIALIAEALEAKAFYERDGRLNSIVFVK